ncbi:annexin A2-like [Astyanax mexicanus]|uniref:Annexin A2-like n=1 Tax=Astyanax mexicanus TaxID=7994 RepID=A0A8T2L3G5_ASTMX|nr:annexin A2-like [Astyanax mexicanus]
MRYSNFVLFAQNSVQWPKWGIFCPDKSFFNHFHPERDVAVIQAALDKKDINTLVRILTNRSNAQRQVLAQIYQNLTKKDLKAGLKKVLSGDLEALMLGLMMTPYQFEAHRLRQAMEPYIAWYTHIYCLVNTKAPLNVCAIDVPQALSEELSNKKVDAGPWIRILTTRDPAHLRNVLIQLEAETGQPVSDVIEKRFGGIFSGDFKLGLKTLGEACVCLPVCASVLQGVMLSHSEEDLLAVRVAYKAQTGTSLYTTLQKQFKGDLQQALLAVCRAED